MADLKAAAEFLDQYAAAINAVVESVSGAVVRVQRHAEEGGGRHRWRMGRARTNHGSGVVIDAAVDWPEWLPAASYASTVYA